VIKYFRFDYDFVLWGISYANLTMLLATIPVYESKIDSDDQQKEEEKEEDGRMEVIPEVSLVDLAAFVKIPKKKP